MLTNPLRALLTLCLLAPLTLANAQVSSDLDSFWQGLGYASDTTGPHVFQSQAAGYYSAGSLFLRSKSRDLQIAQIDLPSLKAGCGGISLFGGGASFINSGQLTQFAKNILSDSIPYGFQLAMETYAPQISNVMTKLQYWAQQMNQNNLTSCEAAQDLVGGLWPKHTAAQRQACQDLGVQSNAFSDWASARQGCGFDGKGDSTLDDLIKSDQGKKVITRNINLVWQSLEKNGFLQQDTELAEFFLSLSGTIIFDKNGKPSIYPALITNDSLLKALMNGGDGTIYQCKDSGKNQCLFLQQGHVHIAPTQALIYRVNQFLIQLSDDYQADKPLTTAQKGFLAKTSLPVLRFIEVSLESGNQIDTLSYAELIAEDLLTKYLEDSLQLIQASLANSQHGELLKPIENNLARSMQVTQQLRTNANKKIQAEVALIAQSLHYQQAIAGQLASRFQVSLGGAD